MKINDGILITQIATREAWCNDRSGRRQLQSEKDPKFTIGVTRDRALERAASAMAGQARAAVRPAPSSLITGFDNTC